MNREHAIPYVAYVVDDAGNGRQLNSDPEAVIRAGGTTHAAGCTRYPSVLVGWQCGCEPLFVAVHSYLDVRLTDDEAEDLAADYLAEIGWFSGGRDAADGAPSAHAPADYIIR